MLYSVLNLGVCVLANGCVCNYASRDTASATKRSVRNVRSCILKSLSGHVKYTANMAEWLSMTSLHRMYSWASIWW